MFTLSVERFFNAFNIFNVSIIIFADPLTIDVHANRTGFNLIKICNPLAVLDNFLLSDWRIIIKCGFEFLASAACRF